MTETNGTTATTHVVRICTGTDSLDRTRSLATVARDEATTATVLEVGPAGVGDLAPLVLTTHDGVTAFHADPTADDVRALVRAVEDGDVSTDAAHAVVDHDPDSGTLPLPEDGPLAVGRRRVLARAGWTVPGEQLDERLATDVVRDDADGADDLIRRVGLLGRGRGDASTDAPVIEEWDRARETVESGEDDPVLVVNANESDDRNRTDSHLLEADPAAVVDGALAVADLLDVEDVVVYCNEADYLARDRVRAAVDTVCEHVDPPKRPQVVAGPDRYIAGEMTMALEAMEGNDRLEARLRPPTPAQHGLYGRPTVIHTPRTIAQIRELLLDPDAFDAGDADPGTRLLTVSGDVDAPATVELSTGGSLEAIREAVTLDGSFKMACVGGQFGGLTRSLDYAPSASGLSGAGLGTEGAVELLADSRCAVATAGKRARFAEEENCGRCVPCREGSVQLTDLLRDVYQGEYKDGMLRELTRTMRATSTCDFGRSAARPVSTAMDRFETEFHAHAEGRCPSGECKTKRHAERERGEVTT
ncbi:NADH-ubiquinone oxidoreductase-F iron-sulfur binding region domain-containing protein [Halogranum rubrum]|uniref:Respiratory-chain NADH dehydrogenase domain 51 kDa subunit n=1 Tax=Halogranum salarium B-1 TaxID=1210908 RepID=J3EZD0_9EURY|nr:NADH-ubiquinone oxidoreductase-F iron-sulfur binding region domain-containing protein [Halogranum salarium]EJN60932.1 Respiratory-chain NADH dehydrogenase domain 51 kDa subunit [Halogranum salarium B-1]